MKFKILNIFLVVMLIIANMTAVNAADENFQGEGTSESPFLIATADDLVKLATLTNTAATATYATKYYQLTNDIDMSGILKFTPISAGTNMTAAVASSFSGTFDGNGHIIKNITISYQTYGATNAIFGLLSGGTVKNLGVENITVNAGSSGRLCIGGIAGSLNSNVTIEECYVRGMNVTSTSSDATYTGGIAGRTIGASGIIKNCYTTNISYTLGNANYSGGIIGGCGNAAYKVENSYTTHSKIQGWAVATNSYIGLTNCYYGSSVANATAAALGNAYQKNPSLKNEGYPLLVWENYDGYELKPKATLTLPALISNHMIIQQNKPIKLWGSAEPEETVTVELKNAEEVLSQVQVTVADSGRFDAQLPQMVAGGPYTLVFKTSDQTVTVEDVLVGDLWVQGGQSNMARPTSGTGSFASGILPQQANNKIRLFMATQDISASSPATDLEGEWKIANSTSVNAYSAVGYVALKKLNDELNLPVGGICNAIGGASMSQFMGVSNGTAGGYYNSKTAPLTQFNVKGVMWYQGEGDRNRTASDFTSAFNSLIATWRAGWNDTELPFVYVMLPPSPMKYYASWTGGYILEDFSSARLGQLQSYYENENVAFAVGMDCPPNSGEDSLHPNNKKPIGERLGLAALDKIYDVIDNGTSPLYKSATVNGNSVVIKFNYAYNGLKTTDNEAPRCFYVSDSENGTYYQADAVISGKNEVTLTCDEVTEIKYVSYAVEKHMYPYTSADDAVINTYADVNLVNSENLPLCPFSYAVTDVRTDPDAPDTDDSDDETDPDPEDPEDTVDPNFEGEGTEESPFLIKTSADLIKLATLTNTSATAETYASKYYQLTQDIDMTGVEYTPISYAHSMATAQGKAFTGTLDGNNHVIKNITFKQSSTYGATYAIIGYLGVNGVVRNLGVENITVNAGTASRFCIGGIAGSIGNATTIENSYVKGMTVAASPSGTDTTTYVGGIAGRTLATTGTIKNCYTTSLDYSGVTNTSTTAGILGSCGNTAYTAENCYTTHIKLQGNTSATNSYMGTINCYVSDKLETMTVEKLGSAFIEDTENVNTDLPLLSWQYDSLHPETAYFILKSGDVEISDGDKNISVENPFVITFDMDMNIETFAGNIKVLKNGEEIKEFSSEKDIRTFKIKLDNEYNTHYTIIVSKFVQSVKDENEKSAKADEKYITFTTAQLPKAIEIVGNVKINGQTSAPSNLISGSEIEVEVEVKNKGNVASSTASLIVTVFGQDGIMKYVALDTTILRSANEILKVKFTIPDNAGENPKINVMVWDSVTNMNAMGQPESY